MKKSMIDNALETLSQSDRAMSFLELWEIVADKMDYNKTQKDDNIAQFYSDLSMDGRFAVAKGNIWDLRKRSSVEVINPDEIDVEDDEDDDDLPVYEEEDEEETVEDDSDDSEDDE